MKAIDPEGARLPRGFRHDCLLPLRKKSAHHLSGNGYANTFTASISAFM
jgi:hypothetical protein